MKPLTQICLIFLLFYVYCAAKSNPQPPITTLLSFNEAENVFRLLNPFQTEFLQEKAAASGKIPAISFTLNELAFNAKQFSTNYALFTSKDGAGTLKLQRSRSKSDSSAEFTLSYKYNGTIRPELCFHVNVTSWQATFIDSTVESVLLYDFMWFILNQTTTELYPLRLDPARRPLIENLFISQGASAALMLDDLHPWAMFAAGGMPDAFPGGPAQWFCFTNQDNKEMRLRRHPEYLQIKLRILFARNIREVHREAVLLGYIARPPPDQQLSNSVLKYPFWSTDSFNWKNGNQDAPEPSQVKELPVNDPAVAFSPFHLIHDGIIQTKLNGNRLKAGKQCADCCLLMQIDPKAYRNITHFRSEQKEVTEEMKELFNLNESHLSGFALMTPEPDSCTEQQQQNIKSCSAFQRNEMLQMHPNFETTWWANKWLSRRLQPNEAASQVKLLAVDAAYKLQDRPVLFQLFHHMPPDKNSLQNEKNSFRDLLGKIVAEAQVASLAGYPYIQPRLLRRANETKPPSIVSYMRWIRLVTFMPSMTIPVPPWYYGPNAVQLVEQFIKIHQKEAMPVIERYLPAWQERGEPLIRPIWYEYPEEASETYFSVMDRFMLGPDLLIYPIYLPEEVATIQLPRGCWRAGWNEGMHFKGPCVASVSTPVFKIQDDTLYYFLRAPMDGCEQIKSNFTDCMIQHTLKIEKA